ncbi:MAG: hypothetical protein COZ16_05610 [Flavobacteriaceae bacterium CG_4_10_14_3_um_filter_31_253]|nr:MAG: hypothetical protein COZ16_05610 [Flavobacteriaceae bacterium CG_4_10_14_3_um_filter_31_253]
MQKIIIEKSESVTTEVQIVNQNTDYINKKMRFEVIIFTKTRFVETQTPKFLEVSNQNKFPIFLEKGKPKMNADNEQEMIGEWDMWEILKKHTTLYEGEKLAEESLKRAFGLIQEPFIFILPKEAY